MTEETINQKSLFRENALKSLGAINDIQSSLKVVEVKSITYLVASLTALLGIMVWGLYGEVSIDVPARGMVLPSKRLEMAEKIYRENRQDRENSLQFLKALLAKKQALFDKHYLTIEELERAKQDYISAKEHVYNIPKLNNEYLGSLFSEESAAKNSQLDAFVFVSHVEGKKITGGMRAYVLPATVSSYEYGYIKGKVMNVSEYPASKESVYSYLGNMSLVDDYFAGGAPFVVKIQLEKNTDNSSGLEWTTKAGAPFEVGAGSAVTAKIINHRYHPFQLFIKRQFG